MTFGTRVGQDRSQKTAVYGGLASGSRASHLQNFSYLRLLSAAVGEPLLLSSVRCRLIRNSVVLKWLDLFHVELSYVTSFLRNDSLASSPIVIKERMN